MTDPEVLRGWLEEAGQDAARVNADSDSLRLVADACSGDPPHGYHGLLKNVEHFEHDGSGAFRRVRGAIAFTIEFPTDYLRSTDPGLQFRVVRVDRAFAHPNVKAGICCLGPRFHAGTRLRSLVEQVYRILTSRTFATDHAADVDAREYYLKHIDEVRRLEAPPLWRRPVARRVRVEELG